MKSKKTSSVAKLTALIAQLRDEIDQSNVIISVLSEERNEALDAITMLKAEKRFSARQLASQGPAQCDQSMHGT